MKLHNKAFTAERKKLRPLKSNVHGGFAAVNRGADYVTAIMNLKPAMESK